MSTKKSASGEKPKPKYEIWHKPKLADDLDGVEDGDEARRIDEAIRDLSSDPRPHGVKKIDDDTYRVRVGDWRIIYLIDDQRRRVVIGRVLRRNEKTYR